MVMSSQENIHSDALRPSSHLVPSRRSLVLAVAALAGCVAGDETPPESRSATQGYGAAVRVVENDAPAWKTGQGWQIAPIPEALIGSSSNPMDDRDEILLHRVQGPRFLSDGRIVVANAGSSEVMVFDSTGTIVTRFGGRGQGPGELEDIVAVHVCGGDSIAVVDLFQTLHLFEGDGTFVRRAQFPLGGRLAPLRAVSTSCRRGLGAAAHADAPSRSSRLYRGCLCVGRLILRKRRHSDDSWTTRGMDPEIRRGCPPVGHPLGHLCPHARDRKRPTGAREWASPRAPTLRFHRWTPVDCPLVKRAPASRGERSASLFGVAFGVSCLGTAQRGGNQVALPGARRIPGGPVTQAVFRPASAG